MRIRINILLFGFMFLSLPGLLAQENITGTGVAADQDVHNNRKMLPNSTYFKPVWNVSLGSSMVYSPHSGSLTGFSVTPVLSMPLSKRLSVYGGASVTRFYMPGGIPLPESGMQTTTGVVSLFGTASYKLNDHIMLYGTGVKHLGTPPPLISPFSPFYSDSFTVGSVLKLGDHFSFGASLRMSGQPYNSLYPFSQFDRFSSGPYPFTPWP